MLCICACVCVGNHIPSIVCTTYYTVVQEVAPSICALLFDFSLNT